MAKCKTVNVCGKRRRICWGANGKIRSNTAAGGGGSRKRSGGKGRSGTKCRTKSGRIKKGCRLTSSGRLVRS